MWNIQTKQSNVIIPGSHPIPDAMNADATSLAVAIHAQKGPNVKPNWFAMSLILISQPLVSNLRADKVIKHFNLNRHKLKGNIIIFSQ